MRILVIVLMLILFPVEAFSKTCIIKSDGKTVCDDMTIRYRNGKYVVKKDDGKEKKTESYRCVERAGVIKCVKR